MLQGIGIRRQLLRGTVGRALAGDKGTIGAIGVPDIPPEDAPAHCDDADYLPGVDPPERRSAATLQLQRCWAHLRRRFNQGVRAAGAMLDAKDRIRPRAVNLSRSSCTFVFRVPWRAKCNALEGFGSALHGVQDFYSHSNWADEADGTRPIGPQPARPQSKRPGPSHGPAPGRDGDSAGRLGHRVLRPIRLEVQWAHRPSGAAKDYGAINPHTGAATPTSRVPAGAPTPPSGATVRSLVGTNFQKAVTGAIADTRRQWVDFRAEVISQHGAKRGNLIVCALTHDDPPRDCGDDNRGRRLAATLVKTRIAQALARGLIIRVSIPRKGTLSATARSGARTAASALPRPVQSGRTSLRLRFTAAGRNALRRQRQVRLVIRVRLVPRTGATQQVKINARLRR